MKFFTPVLSWLGGMIAPFQHAESAPPNTLWPFVKWCLAGAWPVIILAAVLSGAAGMLDVFSAYLLGVLIDTTVQSADPSAYFAQNAFVIAGYVTFYLLLRPVFFGVSAAFNGIVLPPNLAPLIQSRLHRWSLGHSVSFFDDDFAGRIAQKQMQTATALVNVVTEGTEAKSGVLDPLGTGIPDGPDLWFTLMRNMAASMNACLTPTG